MNFIYNDGGRSKYFKAQNVGDCAIRAISIATKKDYKEVYNSLKELNKGVSCRNGTPKKVDKKYLEKIGWKWLACIKPGTGMLVHLNEDELPLKGTIIVQVSKHLTCLKDGILNDAFDCSREGSRGVYGIWYNPNELTNEITQFINKIEFMKKCRRI